MAARSLWFFTRLRKALSALALAAFLPAAELTFAFPEPWTEPDYQAAEVAFRVTPFEPAGPEANVYEQTYAVTEQPASLWDGSGYEDGLYLWGYTATPLEPICPEPAPEGTDPEDPLWCAPGYDPTPVPIAPAYPMIIDREAPDMRTFGDGRLSLEVPAAAQGQEVGAVPQVVR